MQHTQVQQIVTNGQVALSVGDQADFIEIAAAVVGVLAALELQ